jgi:FixJ family two-component response regulator
VAEQSGRVGPERRRRARGGRRDNDRDGYTPMIVVIDGDSGTRDVAEAILAKLRFAVAPFESVDVALSAMRALLPEAVVAREDAAAAISGRLPNDRGGRPIPLLIITGDLATPEALVEALRRLMRSNTSFD